ncbi:uncharacterized protein LOC123620729 isoform X1 [Lemur catta]|uniref:uncharacterized protein LOC123620729 isoform X1 n=1 Tax=Lemur catta TaxID=9447 RepID=UPI001E2692DE|nr:uncharacterized protein LOC123620729 isoform X1 [Lemur catta]
MTTSLIWTLGLKPLGMMLGFLFFHLSSSDPSTLHSALHPHSISSALSDTPPHSLAQPTPTSHPCSAPTFPLDTPLEWKNHPSSLSCSQSWDRTCWSFLFGMAKEIRPGMGPICHHRSLRAVLGRPPAHTECPPWASALLALAMSFSPGTRWKTQEPARRAKVCPTSIQRCGGEPSIPASRGRRFADAPTPALSSQAGRGGRARNGLSCSSSSRSKELDKSHPRPRSSNPSCSGGDASPEKRGAERGNTSLWGHPTGVWGKGRSRGREDEEGGAVLPL